MADAIKFPNLTQSIMKSLDLPKELAVPAANEGEYTIYVNVDDWEAARISVNENNHDIFVSFNYDIDPALVAHIAIIMSGYAHMDIYESYRIDENGEILWWNDDKNEWTICEERPEPDSAMH